MLRNIFKNIVLDILENIFMDIPSEMRKKIPIQRKDGQQAILMRIVGNAMSLEASEGIGSHIQIHADVSSLISNVNNHIPRICRTPEISQKVSEMTLLLNFFFVVS